MHDLLITAGVYALTGREVTTSTVAALLTILGYSLYDTIIVFDRIRENVPRMPRAAFSQIVNRSMSEVLTRSLATSFCTLLPVLALLLFGGETLKDFAFALLVGIALGHVLVDLHRLAGAHALEGARAGLRQRRTRIAASHGGLVPAYAVATAGAPVDVAPARGRRGARAGSRRPTTRSGRSPTTSSTTSCATCTPTPKRPHGDGRARGGRAAGGARARPDGRPRAGGPRAQGRQEEPEAAPAAQPPPREEPLMGTLAWIMMGLALWHFTIWLPDRFLGGIVGAFLGALVGVVLFGLLVNGFTIPGQSDTHLLTALEAIPGALAGIAAMYAEGIRRGNAALEL